MAFGKPPEAKALKNTPNAEDQLWRANILSEETASDSWKTKWGWILNEHEKLQKELKEAPQASATIPMDRKKGPPETRTTLPIPSSVNHEYGWLAARKEFKMEIYGPDIYKAMPFVSLT